MVSMFDFAKKCFVASKTQGKMSTYRDGPNANLTFDNSRKGESVFPGPRFFSKKSGALLRRMLEARSIDGVSKID